MRLVCRATLLAPLLLAGCATLQPPPAADADDRRAALLAIDDWTFRGRVAVRDVDGEGGQAGLTWQQSGERSALSFAGPLGAGRVDVIVEPQFISVSDAGNERVLEYTGADAAERFMAEQLGWSFPVRSARFWMRGLLDPAGPGERVLTEAGQLAGLSQYGWTVTFQRFGEFGRFLLPTKLQLEHPRLRLRVVVGDWLLQESAALPELN